MLVAPDQDQATAMATALRALLPGAVAVAVRPTARHAPPLYPKEARAVVNAVPKRQGEFAAGRAAARGGLAELSLPASAIPMQKDRAPKWPAGVVGSISHTDVLCAAAVAKTTELRSIGIDLEPDAHLPPDVLDAVCAQVERAWLITLPVPLQGRAARILFCAKEAFFKAQYPLTGMMIGFDAVETTIDLDAGTFVATPRSTLGEFGAGQPVRGKWTSAAGHLVCAVVIGHSD